MHPRRGLLALIAAALMVLAAPAGVAAAQCLDAPMTHTQGHSGTSSPVDASGTANAIDHGAHEPCGAVHECCTHQCIAPGTTAPAALPLGTPVPAAPLTPYAQLHGGPAAVGDSGPAIRPVPPWAHPTLELLAILRV